MDDFYLNLVDWSSQNVIAAGHWYGVYCARVEDDKDPEVLLFLVLFLFLVVDNAIVKVTTQANNELINAN